MPTPIKDHKIAFYYIFPHMSIHIPLERANIIPLVIASCAEINPLLRRIRVETKRLYSGRTDDCDCRRCLSGYSSGGPGLWMDEQPNSGRDGRQSHPHHGRWRHGSRRRCGTYGKIHSGIPQVPRQYLLRLFVGE